MFGNPSCMTLRYDLPECISLAKFFPFLPIMSYIGTDGWKPVARITASTCVSVPLESMTPCSVKPVTDALMTSTLSLCRCLAKS